MYHFLKAGETETFYCVGMHFYALLTVNSQIFPVIPLKMSQSGPILVIDDDAEDFELFQLVIEMEKIENPLLHFQDGTEALKYLKSTKELPFLILSDINMPKIGGIALRKIINEDEILRHKSIPFIFFTTSAGGVAVRQAYDLSVQGFFIKGDTVKELSRLIRLIYDYWSECQHPNTLKWG